MVGSLFIEDGAASAGWTIYPPLSALPEAMPGSKLGMTLWLVSMALFVVSSLLGGLNYIVSVINMRTKGITKTRFQLTLLIDLEYYLYSRFLETQTGLT